MLVHMKKIGIMGGTFNPIHIAHLIIAEIAYCELNLDEVWFMPSKKPPHKQNESIAEDIHRANMVKLAISNNPHFKFSNIELEREGLTFTVDTLAKLKEEYPEYEFYFIIGGDSLFKFNLWREPKTILSLTKLIVFGRNNVEDEKIIEKINELQNMYGGSIQYLKAPNIDISSSLIRSLIKENKSITYFVSKEVENYIREKTLYIK